MRLPSLIPSAGLLVVLACGCRQAALRPEPPPVEWRTLTQTEGRSWLGTVGRDLAHGPGRFLDDTRRVFVARRTWWSLLGATLFHSLNETYDEREVDWFRRHSIYGSSGREAFEKIGNGITLFGGTLAWYATALATGNERGAASARTMMSALSVTALTTLGLKAAFDDSRPDGGRYNFPSGHASLSMAFATTLDGLYGHAAGIPAGLLSVLVGLQRLDTLRHDTGSVVFGWTLGYVIGRAITEGRDPRILGMLPGIVYDPEHEGWALTLTGSLP
jgi:membrane-associated phospholipid phosphatase